MPVSPYIQAILPLKLEWEPFYILSPEEKVCVGDRVRVPFAGRMYVAVVSSVGEPLPDNVKPGSVKEIYGVCGELDRILSTEIKLWRILAEYYMCSVGEVYKAAYPSVRNEKVNSRLKPDAVEIPPCAPSPLNAAAQLSYDAVSRIFAENKSSSRPGKPVLLSSESSLDVLLHLCLSWQGNVLWLVPEVNETKVMCDKAGLALGSQLTVWGSNLTPARKREAIRRVRESERYIVMGTRSAIFLPHHDLSLVIVSGEHDASYKQTSPSPRYNGRDSAILLGGIFGADVLLESNVPSLDSILNSLTGKYTRVDYSSPRKVSFEIIDTSAEIRKNGMCGDFSRRLLMKAESPEYAPFAVYKPRHAAFPKSEELLPQLQSLLPESVFYTDDIVVNPIPEQCRTLAIMGVDAMLGKMDFRSDEKAFQTVLDAVIRCRELESVIIQTREPSHPIFQSLLTCDASAMLSERRAFSYPPFSRIVDVVVSDTYPERAEQMTRKLYQIVCHAGFAKVQMSSSSIRVILKKDKDIVKNKKSLMKIVGDFVRDNKYPSHISFDVDPR